MLKLVIFKEAFVARLRKDIEKNLTLYNKDKAWLLRSAEMAGRDLETTVDIKGSLDLLLPASGDLKDAENAVRVHKALHGLTRLQARDPRLWSRLTHTVLWEYMRKRWAAEKYSGDKAVRFIESRYFVAQAQGRALLRNGAARLWWAAHLSYDKERANHYELTEVLFQYLDITQSILERNLGRSSVVTTSFLDFLVRHEKPLLSGGDVNRKRIRNLAKYLNLCGGFCVLDVLSREEILSLLSAEFGRILSSENSAVTASA